jgi:Tfp pilus assembly PilM family ATPase
MTNIALGIGPRCVFTRAVPGGIEAVVIAVAERREMPLEAARELVAQVGLDAPLESLEGDEETLHVVRGALEDGVARVVDAVRSSLDYAGTHSEARPATRAVLTGPAVGIEGVGARLADQLGLPVTVATMREARPGAIAAADQARMAVAAGLSIQEAV